MDNENIKLVLTEKYGRGEKDFREFQDRLQLVRLSNLIFDTCDFSQVIFNDSSLSNVIFRESNFNETCFVRIRFIQSTFYGCTMKGANFSLSSFTGCDLSRCILTESNFEGSILKGCSLDKSILIGSTYNEKTVFPQGFDPIQHGMLSASDESLLEKSRSRNKAIERPTLNLETNPRIAQQSRSQESKSVFILSPIEKQIKSDKPAKKNEDKLSTKKMYFRGRLVGE
ncbi:MAG: pentapeptide repeat-containing protein [Synechococcus sp.]